MGLEVGRRAPDMFFNKETNKPRNWSESVWIDARLIVESVF